MTRIGTFEFVAPLWIHPGDGGWHFVTLPPDVGADVHQLTAGARHGFGSVRVAVRVGGTAWRTSVFPEAAGGGYVLPVKKAVRTAERLTVGEPVHVLLDLVDL